MTDKVTIFIVFFAHFTVNIMESSKYNVSSLSGSLSFNTLVLSIRIFSCVKSVFFPNYKTIYPNSLFSGSRE